MINVNLPKGFVNENSYSEEVLRWLLKGNSLTSLEAWHLFGVSRLSSIIFRLRERHYEIKTEMIKVRLRNGGVARVARYKITDSTKAQA